MDDLLATLDPDQREAACLPDGPAQIVAPAGSGKTTTLVARLGVLLARGVAPEAIAVVTFNREAAAELAARVVARLGPRFPGAERIEVRTLHAMARQVLLDAGGIGELVADRAPLLRAARRAVLRRQASRPISAARGRRARRPPVALEGRGDRPARGGAPIPRCLRRAARPPQGDRLRRSRLGGGQPPGTRPGAPRALAGSVLPPRGRRVPGRGCGAAAAGARARRRSAPTCSWWATTTRRSMPGVWRMCDESWDFATGIPPRGGSS